MPGPDAVGQLQSDMLIANNAVYTSGGPGIWVSNSKNVEIRDNVVSDCNFEVKTHGSIWLQAVSEGEHLPMRTVVLYSCCLLRSNVSYVPRCSILVLKLCSQGAKMQERLAHKLFTNLISAVDPLTWLATLCKLWATCIFCIPSWVEVLRPVFWFAEPHPPSWFDYPADISRGDNSKIWSGAAKT